MKDMTDPGFDITPTRSPLGFTYGDDVFGPEVENRRLDDIRTSLRDPSCSGPDIVYAIAMDVGRKADKQKLIDRDLLFGVVAYAAGRLGNEPVRSQGHVHKKVRGQQQAPPEVYEIWSGRAIILMQETANDDPGRCYAVEAGPGEVVIVPPLGACHHQCGCQRAARVRCLVRPRVWIRIRRCPCTRRAGLVPDI